MEKKLLAKILEYILPIPQLLFALTFSFLSGHLWIWVIYAYFYKTSRASRYINHWACKTALGLFWYMIPLLPIYFYKYGFTCEVDGSIIKIIGFTLLVGSFLQAIATGLIINFKKQS